MPELTTAQALVRFLEQQYIEYDGQQFPFVEGMYAIFGHGNVLGMGQALAEAERLRIYQGRNEQGMGHAAISYAKQRNRKQIIACTSSIGPGSANLVTAAGTATVNNIPLLLFPGDVFASRQPDPVLQQIEQPHDLTITTNDALRPVCKFWDRITRPEQLMNSMIQAMRVLISPAETGAVTVALPQDVQGETYDFPESFFKKRIHRVERSQPVEEAIKEAAALIKKKEKPLLICGGGVRYSEAGEIVKELANSWEIPIAETQAGKSAVETDFSWNVGGLGVTGNLAANRLAREADLIIAVGTKLADFTTSSKQLFQNEHVDFLNINISSYHTVKLDAVQVKADAREGIKALLQEGKGYRSSFAKKVKQQKAEWDVELNRLHSLHYTEEFEPEVGGHMDEELKEYAEVFGGALTQTKVLGLVREAIDENAIITGASGSLPGDLQRMWKTSVKYTYNMEYGFSCMGYEVPGAFGAKLAEPNREVYAMTGDGSYMMLHSELITSLQENKKINVLLFDNASFGCINNLQMGNGMDSIGTEFRKRVEPRNDLSGDILPIDFAKSAAGYGVKTYTATTGEELLNALEDAKNQTISTLIDIKVLPKTMTHDYDSWWHVGVPKRSKKKEVEEAAREKETMLKTARKY